MYQGWVRKNVYPLKRERKRESMWCVGVRGCAYVYDLFLNLPLKTDKRICESKVTRNHGLPNV